MSVNCIFEKAAYRVLHHHLRLEDPVEGYDGRFVLLAQDILSDACEKISHRERMVKNEIKKCIEENSENPKNCQRLFKHYLEQFCRTRQIDSAVKEINAKLDSQ